MLRSVFTTRHGRLAVAFEGGTVLEAGPPDSSGVVKVLTLKSSHGHQEQESDLKTRGDESKGGQKERNRDPTTTTNNAANNGETTCAGNAVDLAYSSDASMLAVATDDKRLNLWCTGSTSGKNKSPVANMETKLFAEQGQGDVPVLGIPGQGQERQQRDRSMGETAVAGSMIGTREIPKKPTSVLFARVSGPPDVAAEGGKEVLVVSDKCGDAYAAPLPDPSSAFKHLLGHTAMTITSMVSLNHGKLLVTGDRAEHIRVSQFPRTSIVHGYLLGHKDFVSALSAVSVMSACSDGDGSVDGGTLLLSGGGDGMVGLWDAETGERLSMVAVREACQELADGDAKSDQLAAAEAEALRRRQQDEKDAAAAAAAAATTATTNLAPEQQVKAAHLQRVDESDLYEGIEHEGGGAERNDERTCEVDDTSGADRGVDDTASGARIDVVKAEIDGGAGGALKRECEGETEGEEAGAREGAGGSESGRDVLGDGVPISLSCSEDGKTVAVVASGLAGLLLLRVSRSKGRDDDTKGNGPAYSLSPLARVQVPTVPIQAGFLRDTIIVALQSPNTSLKAFRLVDDSRKGAVEVDIDGKGGAGAAARTCAAINDEAAKRGLLLKPAVDDDAAAEALSGGLRKHKGTRNAGKSPSGWNNFSMRRDKKQDRKRRRGREKDAWSVTSVADQKKLLM